MLERVLEGQPTRTLTSASTLRSLELSSKLVPPVKATRHWTDVVPGREMDASEVRRRLLHMLPGLLPFILWFIPHPKPWGPILTNVVIVVTAAIVGPALLRFAAFARPGESDGRSSILGYAFPILAALCIFRGHEELGMMTLTILAFGDGSATLGGLLLGGRPLPWNPRKTLTGFLCFLLIGGPLASLVFWGESTGTSLELALICGMGATLTAAIAESLPLKLNDNLRVGFTAVLMGALLQSLVVG